MAQTPGSNNGKVIANEALIQRTGVGSFITFDDGTNTFDLLSCSGSPEGSISGNPGDLAVDILNGALYIKQSGTGNTGWIADASSILTAKGSLVTYSTAPTELPIGANGYLLSVDTSTSTGLKWVPAPSSSPLTTKGDLYGYSTTNARVAVGSDGLPLVADSAQAAGLNYAALTAPAGGTDQTSYTRGDILAATSSSALGKVGLGSIGFSLVSDGTDIKSQGPGSYVTLQEEFVRLPTFPWAYGQNSTGFWQGVKTHTGMGPGVIQGFTSTGTTAGISVTSQDGFVAGNYRYRVGWFIAITALDDGTDTYHFYAGIGNNTNLDYTRGMYFYYDKSTYADGYWRTVCQDGGGSDIKATTSTVSTDPVFLEVEVNAAGTSVAFYIDGTLVNTHTSNIDTSTGLWSGASFVKTAGTTSRGFYVDYTYTFVDWSASPRF